MSRRLENFNDAFTDFRGWLQYCSVFLPVLIAGIGFLLRRSYRCVSTRLGEVQRAVNWFVMSITHGAAEDSHIALEHSTLKMDIPRARKNERSPQVDSCCL